MNQTSKPFILRLLFISVIMEVIAYGFYFFKPDFFSYYLLVIPLYFFLLLTFFHISLLRSTQKRAQAFVAKYMLLTGIKLFVNLGILLAIVFSLKDKIVVVVIGFLVQYIVFTAFEVRELLKTFSKNN